MPAPEENREALLRFLLVKNAELRDVHFAIGPEEGVYLMTQIPMNEGRRRSPRRVEWARR